jgi:hypothetical protein
MSNDLVDMDDTAAPSSVRRPSVSAPEAPKLPPSGFTRSAAAALFNPFEDDEPNQSHEGYAAAAPADSRASSAQPLISPFDDDDSPVIPTQNASSSASASAFFLDAPTTATVAAGVPLTTMLLPSRAPAPVPLDIFADELLSPTSTLTPGGFSAPNSTTGYGNFSQKGRNPLDVLSLYDQPPTAPNTAPKTGMSGHPIMGSPAGMFNPGMSPMGVGNMANGSMKSGAGFGMNPGMGGVGVGMGTPQSRPMSMGMNGAAMGTGMGMGAGMGAGMGGGMGGGMGAGMGGGGMNGSASVGRGPLTPASANSAVLPLSVDTFTLGASPAPRPAYGGPGMAPNMGMQVGSAGRPQQFPLGSGGKPSVDPFDSINLFKR